MDYVKLDVWQHSRRLAGAIYNVTAKFPKEEIFGLTNQLRRASVSVPSNIAEGCGRKGARETVQFLYISRGSLFEIETQCYLAWDLKYLNKEEFELLFDKIQNCKRLLNGFINHYIKL